MSTSAGGVFLSIPFGPARDWRTGTAPLRYTPSAGDKFVETLGREIRLRSTVLGEAKFDTVYFGGCGPTCLTLDQLYRILRVLYDTIPIVPREQTIVVLPGTVDAARAKVLLESGFDRVELRTNDPAAVRTDFDVLRRAGFATVGVELEAAGDPDHWEARLSALAGLEPDRIALFGGSGSGPLFERGRARLQDGYREYGPQHFVRHGHECQFLEAAWAAAPLLGLGPGATTRLAGRCEHSDSDPGRYGAALKRNRLPLVPMADSSAPPYAPAN